METSKKGLKLIGLIENVDKARLEIEIKLTEIEVTPLFHFSHIYFTLFYTGIHKQKHCCCVWARHFNAYFGKQDDSDEMLQIFDKIWTCWILSDEYN